MKLNNEINISFDGEYTAGRGRHFTSKFIEAGLVSYGDSGILNVTKSALDKFCQTMVGCPITIEHIELTDSNVDELRKGVISSVWFDVESGWFCCDGVIWDKKAIELIEKGWAVSCTYEVLATTGQKGEWHNMSYDDELLDGRFEYLALVSNPRYEEATILLNSKEDNKKMFEKVFNSKKIRKLNNEDKEMDKKEEKSEEKNNAKDELMEMINKAINSDSEDERKDLVEKLNEKLDELTESKKDNSDDDEKDSKEEEKEEKDNKCKNDDSDDSDEDDEKDNSDDEDDESKKSESDEEDKDNSDDEEEKKDEDKKDKKDNSKLKRLHNSGDFEPRSGYKSEAERLALGKEMF